jgi:glycosyltransferase involved in cell wall biosynthesis
LVTVGKALSSRGHEVEFFIYYPHIDHFMSSLTSQGITVHSVAKQGRFDPRPPIALRRLIRSNSYDVSLSFLSTPNLYNIFACANTDTMAVVSERSAFPDRRLAASTRLRINTHRLADHVVVNSFHQHERICTSFPWMAEKSSVITNGLDLAHFQPAAAVSEKEPGAAVELLAVGRIHSGKNYVGLIEGLKRYRDSFGEPPIVRWAGREPTHKKEIESYDRAQEMIDRYDLSQNWQWLGVRNDIPALLERHDAFVHPSFYEGLPNAICEALAMGRPTLASNVCDNPWLVRDGARGFLFDPLDPDDICSAIRRFALLDSSDRVAMGRNARSFAESTLGIDRLTDAYEDLMLTARR